MRFYLQLSFLYFSFLCASHAQTINAYARVTGLSGATLTISNVNESFDTFEDGEEVLIFQVQDAVLNSLSSSNNTNSFGNLNNIQSAGLFEVAKILSHTETAGVVTSITLTSTLGNTYNINNNSRLQIISYPELGTPNFATTASITGLPWNGNIGGVVAFQVTNQLTLNHSIIANGIGFRGGSRSANRSGSYNCTTGTVVHISNSNQYGEKGEGIYRNNNNNFRYARAKILNGGGGGSHHNGGGAGGGNQTSGGDGGTGYSGTSSGCPLVNSCGGTAGIGLHNYISNNRLFLGGGGGGGQQNNSRSTNGGNGGGFIFIKANTLVVPSCTSPPTIEANGQTAANGGNDGIGGGGAGGSILLDIQTYTIPTGCTLEVMTNGGNGGDVNSGRAHGGGGGGGQGAIRLLNSPPASVVGIATSGNGGCNDASCSSVAGSGADSTILLPISLTHFNVNYDPNHRETILNWETEFETNNAYFDVQKSEDGFSWESIATVASLGNASHAQYYQYTDQLINTGTTYYRLQQVDLNGKYTYSPIRSVYIEPSTGKGVTLMPNPTLGQLELRSEYAPITYIRIYTSLGQLISTQVPTDYTQNGHLVQLQLRDLDAGIYILHTNIGLFKVQKN
ncbi:T9SS type A sorting domain-containing protein [Aureispira anguillae]|uniref:RNA-binding protein n=1 Tax=Aureispira anguillae TaxID=2864201 RepID=A0A916DW97_9BACT|nr:T9SS type A sorting domain-containing protein [Aureispira anguillae]BDS15231.1 RNA-binding protein [Aureispira anguillae]